MILNTREVDFTKEPMFFGQPLGIQRFDKFKYPIFDKLTERQMGLFWRPQEVSLQKDRNDYAQLRPEHKFIFTSNLKYQTMLDSVQGRGPLATLGPIISLPELEACVTAWQFFEQIHSRSYTHIIKNLYPNPEEIFDSILSDPMIMARAKSVTQAYDHLDNVNHPVLVTGSVNIEEEKKRRALYRALININILEGIRFYVSFACTFAFGEMKLMEGSAKIISLIARDEAQHLAITQHILNLYTKEENDPYMKKVMAEDREWVVGQVRNAVDEEKVWAKHLMSMGSMIGVSEPLLCDYIEWMANKRLKAIGFEPIYDQKASANPLPWTQHWLNSRELQNAPQETEIESYIVGGLKQDVSADMFKEFKL